MTIMISVTVTCAEGSFSKLKLIKDHLRSTIAEERLNNGLSLLLIEYKLMNSPNLDEIMQNSTGKKVRRVSY